MPAAALAGAERQNPRSSPPIAARSDQLLAADTIRARPAVGNFAARAARSARSPVTASFTARWCIPGSWPTTRTRAVPAPRLTTTSRMRSGDADTAGRRSERRCIAEPGHSQAPRSDGALRGRAEHEIGAQALLADQLPHPRGRKLPARRELTLAILGSGLVPAGLGVAQEKQLEHLDARLRWWANGIARLRPCRAATPLPPSVIMVRGPRGAGAGEHRR